jgi:hypothetical protein
VSRSHEQPSVVSLVSLFSTMHAFTLSTTRHTTHTFAKDAITPDDVERRVKWLATAIAMSQSKDRRWASLLRLSMG